MATLKWWLQKDHVLPRFIEDAIEHFLVGWLYIISRTKKKLKFYQGIGWFVWICKNITHVDGINNLPSQGPYVIACNHMGSLNIAFVIGALHAVIKQPIYIVVEERVYNANPRLAKEWLAFLPRSTGILEMIRQLRKGQVCAITPAGTRDRKNADSIDEQAMSEEAKIGIGILSDRASFAPVVPVGFQGPDSNSFLQSLKGLIDVVLFRKIKIKVGKTLIFEALGRDMEKHRRREVYLERARQILSRVFGILNSG